MQMIQNTAIYSNSNKDVLTIYYQINWKISCSLNNLVFDNPTERE